MQRSSQDGWRPKLTGKYKTPEKASSVLSGGGGSPVPGEIRPAPMDIVAYVREVRSRPEEHDEDKDPPEVSDHADHPLAKKLLRQLKAADKTLMALSAEIGDVKLFMASGTICAVSQELKDKIHDSRSSGHTIADGGCVIFSHAPQGSWDGGDF